MNECAVRMPLLQVKTIGDAFMVASDSAEVLLRLAMELQVSFFRQDWGTKAIETVYQKQQALVFPPPVSHGRIVCSSATNTKQKDTKLNHFLGSVV